MSLKKQSDKVLIMRLKAYEEEAPGQIQYYIDDIQKESRVTTWCKKLWAKYITKTRSFVPYVPDTTNYTCKTLGIRATQSAYAKLTNGSSRYMQNTEHLKVDKFELVPDTIGGTQC